MAHKTNSNSYLSSSSHAVDLYGLPTTKANTMRLVSTGTTDDDDDMVVLAPPPGKNPFDRAPLGDHDEGEGGAPRGRFVAGEEFFNYAAFGSLREGLPAITLFSPQYFGLAINALIAGATDTFFGNAFLPLLVVFLTTYHEDQIKAGEMLVQWPGTLAVLIGLCSDCFPLFGYRRKSYMALGWLLAGLMFAAMGVLSYKLEETASGTGYIYLILSVGAALGSQIAWTGSLALAVELAQREHLYERGQLAGIYYALRYGAGMVTQIVITQLLHPQDDGMWLSEITLGESAFILSGMCLLPLPAVLAFLHEDQATTTTASSWRVFAGRVRELWNLLQQKVVYCVFFFLVGGIFLISAKNLDVQNAIMLWSGIGPSKTEYVFLAMVAPKFLSAVLWKSMLVNFNWRSLTILGVVIYAICTLLPTLLAAYDVYRQSWFNFTMLAVGEFPQAWLELFILLLPTEIAEVGREGATIGLVNSFLVLITIAANSLWESVNGGLGIHVSVEDILFDGTSTRHTVVIAAVVYAVINLTGVGFAWFMPSQKLDAQQLRAFGGYNRMARSIIVFAFVALVVYDMVENLFSL